MGGAREVSRSGFNSHDAVERDRPIDTETSDEPNQHDQYLQKGYIHNVHSATDQSAETKTAIGTKTTVMYSNDVKQLINWKTKLV